MSRQLSSRAFALVAAAGNVAVCCAIVTLQFAFRPEDPWAEAIAAVETFPDTVAAPAGYQLVSGPGGMTTRIPADWPTTASPAPGAMQADDPAGTSVVLRYGGSVSPVADSYLAHAEYERQFSRGMADYVPLRLARTDVRGKSAVDWEFEYDEGDGRRHVRCVYWLAKGHEYFVYASSPATLWPQVQGVFDVMLSNSTP